MLLIVLLIVAATLAGALSGSLTARRLLRRREERVPVQPDESDPWVSAEIDQAVARWAMEHGRPEAAGLMADKLHLLHRLSQRRRWWT